MLDAKINAAVQLVRDALSQYSRPAVMCSFGKDSMVVLDIVQRVMPRPAVIFHREPYQHHKYAFANKVIADKKLMVYDWPHSYTAMANGGGETEIVKFYGIGNSNAYVPVGTRADGGDDMVCGLRDIYYSPTGTYDYPWDLVFHGHKSSDVDPVMGAVPLKTDLLRNEGSASAAFVIRDFTDADVWEYTERFNLPVHTERYEKVDGVWREREDKTYNPDYLNACTACMVHGKDGIPCPMLGGALVNNISHTLNWTGDYRPDYIGK